MKRFGSLRYRLVAVVVAIVALPVVFVWLTAPFDDAVGAQLRQSLKTSTEMLGDNIRKVSPDEDFQRVADSFEVRAHIIEGDDLRVYDGTQAPSLREKIMFAPDTVPSAKQWDDAAPPLVDRDVLKEAEKSGVAGRCRLTLNDTLLVCEYARRIEFGSSKPRFVYAIAASPRSLGSLYDERFAVLRLMFVVLLFGAALGTWLGLRVGRPLSKLRDQVLARTAAPVSTAPIDIDGAHEIAEVGHAFNALLAALERRNAATEGFMADMAHEIKNPLAAIRAVAESMPDREMDAQRATRVARVLRESSARLEMVVARFLELAHAESGLPRVEREELDLRKLLENLVETMRHDERYTEQSLSLHAVPGFVEGSAEHIETVFRNLISNAQSFARSTVSVRMVRLEDQVEVRVKDDGPGIAEDDLPRVFDRFFTRRADGSGTGLGLAMVYAIVEAHAGQIRVDSTPGHGAEFVVTFPLVSSLTSA